MSAGKLKALIARKGGTDKIACITAYDATFARVAATAGIDAILVGDSLGMVLHGKADTLQVRLNDMIYHSRITRAGASDTPLITDMPFASTRTVAQATGNAVQLVQNGLCDMVKLEGGDQQRLQAVRAITAEGIPVCAHLGMLPQSVLLRGGYHRVPPTPQAHKELTTQAAELQQAGASMLVLECVPRELAAEITASIDIPVIGIGAGANCDGQVLVLHDVLGLNPDPPFFSKDFTQGGNSILDAVRSYTLQVRDGSFPQQQHSYGADA